MGGRRRSSANKPVPKRRPKLDKIFKCPVCSHDGSTVQITKQEKGMEAVISCKVCKESHKYRKRVTFLTEPIDVFSDWLDFRESREKSNAARRPSQVSSAASPMGKGSVKKQKRDEEEEEEAILAAPSVRSKKADAEEEEEQGAKNAQEDEEDEDESGSESSDDDEEEDDEDEE